MITAPPFYGKSTNLDMIRRFLEIEVGENGMKITKANFSTEPVKDTVNYRLFNDNALKIRHEVGVANEYLGRTPVMSVSFKCDCIITEEGDVLKYFQKIAHQTFLKYKFLTKNNKLEVLQKDYIEKWCDSREYNEFDKQKVVTALRELSEYIYYYFDQRRVFVLIDDYDSAIRSAVFSVSDNDVLDSVIQFSATMTNTLLKRNARYVQGGVMTGVWDIPAVGAPPHNTRSPDSFQIYRFLDDHRFVNYYGATVEEVETLISNSTLSENLVSVTSRYNGYLSKRDTKIYNLYSLLNFLYSRQLKNFWTYRSPKKYIKHILKIPFAQKNVTELLKNESIYIESVDKITVNDFLLFRNVTKNTQLSDVNRILFFLFAEGYLTYKSGIIIQIDKETPKIGVRCPNDEIKEYFEKAIKYNSADC